MPKLCHHKSLLLSRLLALSVTIPLRLLVLQMELGILHDIRMLSSSLNSISFHFISRLENGFADGLAKSALNLCMISLPIVE